MTIATVGRHVVDVACPACGAMYLVGEPWECEGRVLGRRIVCAGCGYSVGTQPNAEYAAVLKAETEAEEAEREAAAREDYEDLCKRRSVLTYRKVRRWQHAGSTPPW